MLVRNFSRSKHTAEKIWKELCLLLPPTPILEVAKYNKLEVLDTHFQDSGISGLLDIKERKIYLNQSDSPQYKRFTVARQLGHYLLHLEKLRNNSQIAIYYGRAINGETAYKEQEANCFAANLLVPFEPLKILHKKLSINELAKAFAVSNQVIGYRIKYG